MTIRYLEMACFAKPFEPFFLHLADGRELHIPHPEFIGFLPSKWIVTVFDRDGSRNLVDLELVTTLRFPHVES